MNRKAHGFTIVELLIVIVVIAILAAITIAAYTNIQDRANDAVAQQNLRDAMNKLRVYEAAKGVTPIPNSSSGSELTVAMEGFSVSRNAYATGNISFIVGIRRAGYMASARGVSRGEALCIALPMHYRN